MASVFSKIITGEIPCYKVAETEKALAFLDISPLAKGHVLVVPKLEVDQFFDLPDADYVAVMALAKKVAKAQRLVMPCKRIGVAVIGLDVPHAHVHLIPLQTFEDINFTREKLSFPNDVMRQTADLIAAAIQ